jgi:deoxyadenosine/deoxycytidine kinase
MPVLVALHVLAPGIVAQMYVAVAGNIGAGKSTLVALLADRYALQPVFEAVDANPYLADFYADMHRWAFGSQLSFLASRVRQHVMLVNPQERVVQDRTLDEDADVFARGLFEDGYMDERDFGTYRALFEAVRGALRPPDLLVYLRAGIATTRRHIAQRGRDYERLVDETYLRNLATRYERFVASYDRAPVVTVDLDRLDLVGRAADRAQVFDLLERRGLAMPVVR